MSALLDVIISLVFLYLLLGLICTILNELVSSALSLRSKNLQENLKKLLSDNDGGQLVKLFEATGIMKSASSVSGKNGPSYLAPENFTAAIIEAGKTAKSLSGPIESVMQLSECIDALPDSNMKKSLSALIDGTGDEINEAKTRIGDWFDSMMDRAAGQFNRKMKAITAVFAVLVTIAFNADTLAVSNALWKDASLRGQISESAAAFVAEAKNVDELAEVQIVHAQLRPFPIGWDVTSPVHSADWFASLGGFLSKLLGWIITALAVSLGAPFWFDLLKKLVSLRGTGPSPKAKQQPSTGT